MTRNILHIKLSVDDKKPKCALCDDKSLFYCNKIEGFQENIDYSHS